MVSKPTMRHFVPTGNALADDFLTQASAELLARMGASHPAQVNAWEHQHASLRHAKGNQVSASATSKAIASYMNRLQIGSKAMEQSLQHLASGQQVVVGGQQAVVLCGPLMVLYKAATIIATARYAQSILHEPIVPVFWIAGEDHDWDEVDHTYLSQGDELARIRLNRKPNARTSISRISISEQDIQQVLDDTARTIADRPFKAQLLELLARSAHGIRTLSDWFARILFELFGSTGLLLLDPDEPAIRELQSKMFIQLIEHNEQLESSIRKGVHAIRSLGYREQVQIFNGATHLFHIGDERQLLVRDDQGQFESRSGSVRFTKEELVAIATTNPQSLSTSALSRPLMQQALLPVLATVLGPAELAYWAMLKEAFEFVNLPMPLLVPRIRATIIEPAIAKHLNRYELRPPYGDGAFMEQKLQMTLQSLDEFQTGAKFAALRQEVATLYRPVIAQIAQLDRALEQRGFHNLERIQRELAFMEQQVWASQQRRHEVIVRQFRELQNHLHPLTRPQERVLNFSALASTYGFEWIEQLQHLPICWDDTHYYIYL